jgi:hypothetical protein
MSDIFSLKVEPSKYLQESNGHDSIIKTHYHKQINLWPQMQ